MITSKKLQDIATIIFKPVRFEYITALYNNPDYNEAEADDHAIVNAIKKLEETKMWISSLKLNSRPKVPKIAVVWNSLHTYLKENHDADVIMAKSQRKKSASLDSTSGDDDEPYSPDEDSDNGSKNNPCNNANQQRGATNEPSASSAPVEQNKKQEQQQGHQD